MSWSDLGVPEPSGNETPAPQPPKPPKPPRPAREPREPRGPRGPRGPGSRTPLILGIVAGVLLVAVVVTLGFALTRPSDDTPAQTSAPSSAVPTAQPSQSASTEPDETGEPVAVTFSGTGFALVDDDGDPVFTFGWRDEVGDAVTALTEAFGAAPTQRVEPGDGNHYPDYTVYQWDGFMLFDMVPTAGGTSRADYTQPTYALFSRNEIGGIALTAEHGLAIGSTIAEVRAAGPSDETPRGNVGAIRFTFDRDRSSTADPLQYSMFADTDGKVVTAILYYFASGL